MLVLDVVSLLWCRWWSSIVGGGVTGYRRRVVVVARWGCNLNHPFFLKIQLLILFNLCSEMFNNNINYVTQRMWVYMFKYNWCDTIRTESAHIHERWLEDWKAFRTPNIRIRWFTNSTQQVYIADCRLNHLKQIHGYGSGHQWFCVLTKLMNSSIFEYMMNGIYSELYYPMG